MNHPFLHEDPKYHYPSADGVALFHMQKVWILMWRPSSIPKHSEPYIKEGRFDKADKAYHKETCGWAATQGWSADYLGYPCWWERNGDWDRGRVRSENVFSTKEAAEKILAEIEEKYGK